MDKQKQIEVMAKDFTRFEITTKQGISVFSEKLYDLGYRKIPENAVVIPKEISCYENIEKRVRTFRIDGNNVDFTDEQIMALTQILHIKERNENEIRKETAEKCAKRLKELEEALLDMVVQFCQMGKEGELRHSFMSAEEQAFDVLDINYGEKVYDVYERFNKKWDRPIDEICKEFTGKYND